MSDPFDFTGKVALVTGSGRGIGAGIVTALGQRGATCIVNYFEEGGGVNKADAERVAAGLKGARVLQCNVANAGEVAAMADAIRKDFGGLDILVNNAGLLRDRSLKKMTLEDFESVLRVNLYGPFHTIRAMLELMRPEGRIVNLSSLAAFQPFFGQANYAPSKAGVVALTKVAARELARNQTTVNAIAPGVIDTEMTRGMPEEAAKKVLEQIPLGRLGTVDDIVGAALFLCSPLARYITGQVIHVNGGIFMS